ncbi:MAG: hypothetical protein PSV22_14375 [Pseudolabrys sp.]|nr:hypothetical protein [Pseudolabrys sp.]
MINATLKDVSLNFFKEINAGMDKATTKSLNRAGTLLRRRARRLTNKKAKLGHYQAYDRDGKPTMMLQFYIGAKPGEPPRKRRGMIRDTIVYARDGEKRSIVVGPTLSSSPTGAPSTLEFGGSAKFFDRDARGGPKFDALGRVIFKDVRIEPRPYMSRSLMDMLPELPKQWANSLEV